MKIVQKPDTVSFSSMLGDIIVEADEDIIVTLKPTTSDNNILSETYTPDSNGKIYICGLDKIITHLIRPPVLMREFQVSIAGMKSGSATSVFFDAIYATTLINGTDSKGFIDRRFLTALNDLKSICKSQIEYISLISDGDDTLNIVAHRRDGTSSAASKLITSGPNTVKFYPEMFVDPDDILYITAVCGNRRLTYDILPTPPRSVQFQFLNPFGRPETFIAQAVIDTENKYTSGLGTFAGLYRLYNRELIKEHTVHTGILTPDTADWLEGMFISPEVYIISEDGILVPIVITEAKCNRSSARDALISYEFKYRLSQSNHSSITIRSLKIFDETFDLTFN
jgi:hypothetical protein